jgi:hypothetical protein
MQAAKQAMVHIMPPFNSLKSFDRLTNAGVSEQQAREFVGIFEESLNSSIEHLATRADLQLLETSLRSDMQVMEAGIRADMQAMEAGIRSDMQAMEAVIRSDMQAMGTSLRAEFKADINELKIELKHDIGAINNRLSALETGLVLMQRLFFGGTLLTLLGIGGLFLHQG